MGWPIKEVETSNGLVDIIRGENTGMDFKITAITEACEEMNARYRGQFIPDEENSIIRVRMPYYKATIKIKKYHTKSELVRVLKKCANINKQREEQEKINHQNKLF